MKYIIAKIVLAIGALSLLGFFVCMAFICWQVFAMIAGIICFTFAVGWAMDTLNNKELDKRAQP